MNAAKAKRRWEAWRRYGDRYLEHLATPGAGQAYNEWVFWVHSGLFGHKVGPERWRRLNRRTKGGSRR